MLKLVPISLVHQSGAARNLRQGCVCVRSFKVECVFDHLLYYLAILVVGL